MASSSWWSGWMIRSKKPGIPASNGKEQVDPDESQLENYVGKSIFEHGSMFWSASPASCGATIPDELWTIYCTPPDQKAEFWTEDSSAAYFYQCNWASWAVASPPFFGRLSFSGFSLFLLFGFKVVALLQLSLSKLELFSKLELLELELLDLELLELKLLGSWDTWAISPYLLWAALLLQLQKAGPGSPIETTFRRNPNAHDNN